MTQVFRVGDAEGGSLFTRIHTGMNEQERVMCLPVQEGVDTHLTHVDPTTWSFRLTDSSANPSR